MKRWLKIVIGGIGALIGLVIIALVGLALFFDPNDYKPQIDAAIQHEIGRRVTIAGDIKLSVFPWLGLDLGRVTIANAPGFADKSMATAKSVELSVQLLPLFARRIHIGTVSLHGLRLRLARNAQGQTNWNDIVRRLSADQDGASTPPPKTHRGSGHDHGFDLNSLRVGAINIENAAIVWSDAASGADYRLTGVKIETGRLSNGKPFRLEMSGNLAAPHNNIQAKLNLVAQIEADLVDRFYRFSKLSLNILANGKAIPGGRQEANLSASGDLDLVAGRFKLADVALQSAGLNINGHLDGTGINSRLAYNGRITIQDFNPRSVMQQMQIKPPATQKHSALSSAGFDAQVNGGSKQAHFTQVVATLDDSTLQGAADIRNFAHPKLGFNLSLDQLNVDNYLPPGSAAQAQSNAPAKTGGGADQEKAEIDLGPLKWLALEGRMTVGSLIAANIHFANAKIGIKAHHGVLTIAPLTAALYGGKLQLHGRIDANPRHPRYGLKGELAGLQFAPLLEDVAGTRRVSGRADMDIDLTTAGKQVATMKRALNGRVGFAVKNGAFQGFNLAQLIAAARSRSNNHGQSASNDGVSASNTTRFNRFAGHFDINQGVLTSKDLALHTKLVNTTGRGRYDLAHNALDYTLEARVAKNASGALSNLAGVAVPIKLSGSLLSPDYKLDMASAVRDVARKHLDQEKSKLEKKLGDKLKGAGGKLGDQIQRGISNFLGDGKEKQKSHDSGH